MPPLVGIRIELDNPVKAFFPGQVISGYVVIENEKDAKSTGLKITFDGKARVSWSERVTKKDGNSRRFLTVFYTSEINYFQSTQLLWGTAKNDLLLLPQGRSTYSFEYTLPENLPSSFVNRIGNVSYIMEATLQMPHNRSDSICIVPFTVNGILDLNLEPGAALPFETRKYKSICCLCCTSGPVGFVFNLPRKSFVPGEIIDFRVELSNQSSQRIYGMKVTLMQVCKFHAEGNSKTTLRSIRHVQGPEVEPGDSELWQEKNLRIPPIPPSGLATCRIIDVQYSLKIEMPLPNVSYNLKEEIPITIGTIPLRDTFRDLNSSASTMTLSPSLGESLFHVNSKPSLLSEDSNDDAFYASGDFQMVKMGSPSCPRQIILRTRGLSISSEHPSFMEYPDLPPPSYQEAIMLDKSPEEENACFTSDEAPTENTRQGLVQSANFIPQYVTYGGD